MSIMLNPLQARLSISRFWVSNFLPTIHSNYPLSTKRNYENFVGLLENFLFCFFSSSKLRKMFFKSNVVYSTFHFNCFGFPKKNAVNLPYLKQHHYLELIFYDFETQYRSTLFLFKRQTKLLFQSVLRQQYNFFNDLRRRFSTEKRVMYLKLLRTQKQISIVFDILKIYMNLHKDFKRIMTENISKFNQKLKVLFFYRRLMKLYYYFFSYNKLNLKIRFIPFSFRFNANFLSHFIINKVKLGTPVIKVLNIIFKFVSKNQNINGIRVVCGGRFNRGQKAGFLIRSLGRFNFGFFDSFKKGYTLDYSETTLHLKKGLVGIRIWLCHKIVDYRLYPNLQNHKSLLTFKRTKYKSKYKHYNVI